MNWIFQANPEIYQDIWDVYDNREQVRNWDVGLKLTPRHYEMRQGDPAAIWVCGRRAGVYAITSIKGRAHDAPPRFQHFPIVPKDRWNPDYDGEWRWWVDLGRTHWLDRPIPRETLKADPRFAGARVIRQPWAPNPFLTTDEEWHAITSARRFNHAR
jgi:hypothetical protein